MTKKIKFIRSHAGVRKQTRGWFGNLIIALLLTAVGIFMLLPVEPEVRAAAFVLGSCPAATMIQGLAESFDGDSETAANIILFTSITCILTIPLLWSCYNLIF